jgi:hypothetical protein
VTPPSTAPSIGDSSIDGSFGDSSIDGSIGDSSIDGSIGDSSIDGYIHSINTPSIDAPSMNASIIASINIAYPSIDTTLHPPFRSNSIHHL